VVAAWIFLESSLIWYTPHFERSDLVGVYVAKYSNGTEKLTLNEDGIFLQEVELKEPRDSAPVNRTGSWTWDESRQRLSIHDCWGGNDGHGRIRPLQDEGAVCSYPLAREWWGMFGRLYLGDQGSAPLWKVD
jgi:hypothetical protein